jgi:Icc-related predicted phosphoesterase
MALDGSSKIRVAAVGDLHVREDQHGRFRQMVKTVNSNADVLLLCGDLTDHGKPMEAKTLAEDLSGLRIPCAAVLGNHDYENGHADVICAELGKVGVRCLDGDHVIFEKVLGVAGVKGFAGGFRNAMLQAFGEGPIKDFVNAGVQEALKLESALAQLDTEKRIVIMHYAPIAETCEGENPQILPFLGTSRLATPVDQFKADCVFHGHAHHGSYKGATPGGVPVYNVALALMARVHPETRFALIEV